MTCVWVTVLCSEVSSIAISLRLSVSQACSHHRACENHSAARSWLQHCRGHRVFNIRLGGNQRYVLYSIVRISAKFSLSFVNTVQWVKVQCNNEIYNLPGTGHEGTLKSVQLPIVSNKHCQQLHRETLQITDAKVCAGGNRDEGVCEVRRLMYYRSSYPTAIS